MYSGTTLRSSSGNIMGAHQKLDRVARRRIAHYLPEDITFPAIKDILHFEGRGGPDGIKTKSPARDEPWHYIDPTDPNDRQLITHIEHHIVNLTSALLDDNYERAAYEAAWVAHAIVDGLTPAHYYPLEEKIQELWGKPREERLTIRDKNIIIGNGKRDTVSKNWQYWGAKGVWTTHFMFEWGFATTIASQRFEKAVTTPEERARVEREGIVPYFCEAMQQTYAMGMYETFYKKGWTRRLASQARGELAPLIIRTVSLAWYSAAMGASRKKAS